MGKIYKTLTIRELNTIRKLSKFLTDMEIGREMGCSNTRIRSIRNRYDIPSTKIPISHRKIVKTIFLLQDMYSVADLAKMLNMEEDDIIRYTHRYEIDVKYGCKRGSNEKTAKLINDIKKYNEKYSNVQICSMLNISYDQLRYIRRRYKIKSEFKNTAREEELKKGVIELAPLYSDNYIAKKLNTSKTAIQRIRSANGIIPYSDELHKFQPKQQSNA